MSTSLLECSYWDKALDLTFFAICLLSSSKPLVLYEVSSLKYPYEVLFRSLYKLLMDTATSEYPFLISSLGRSPFSMKFLLVNTCCLYRMLSVIAYGPFAVIDEHFNSILPNCYDAIGLMLMIHIVHQHQTSGGYNMFAYV
ncbi:hypothetical protein V6N13_120812 [Hibiscus sabdariffa]